MARFSLAPWERAGVRGMPQLQVKARYEKISEGRSKIRIRSRCIP